MPRLNSVPTCRLPWQAQFYDRRNTQGIYGYLESICSKSLFWQGHKHTSFGCILFFLRLVLLARAHQKRMFSEGLQLTMDLFLLLTPPLLRFMVVLVYRNLWVVDHLHRKFPPELQVALLGISGKMLKCSLCVDVGDPQDESKHSVWPVTRLPSYLDRNRLHAVVVIVVDHMPILVVVVEDLCAAKRTNLLLSVGIVENPFFYCTLLIHCSVG